MNIQLPTNLNLSQKLRDQQLSLSWLLLFAVIIMLFSASIRYIWITEFSDVDAYQWNDEIMLTTNDAYHYATSAKLAVDGQIHNNSQLTHNPLFGENGAIIAAAWLTAKLTSWSMDTITLYLPIILPGITGVLVLLIGHMLGSSVTGLLGGLMTVSSKIFLVRTRAGYFDTDLMTMIIPLALIYLLLRAMKTEDLRNALVASLMLTTQTFFYNNAPLLSETIIILFIGYTALLKRENIYYLGSILILLPAMVSFDIPTSIRIALIIGAYFIVSHHKTELEWLKKWTLLGTLAVLPLSHLGERGWDKISYFFTPSDTTSSSDNISFTYTSIASTVEEVKQIPWDKIIDLISSSEIIFYLSLTGLLLLILLRFKSVLLLGLLALGATSIAAGERFTIFAVPPLSLGFSFLVFIIAQGFRGFSINDRIMSKNIVQGVVVALLIAPTLYINSSFAKTYNAPPILVRDEAMVLDAMGQVSQPHDKIISWWDYGYEIHYFAGRQTIASGSASPQQLFVLSTILSSHNPQLVANIAKMLSENGTEDIEKHMKRNAKTGQPLFAGIMESRGTIVPEKSHDKYIYMPSRMIDILPTIYSMSAKNLLTGERFPYTLYLGQNAKKTGPLWEIDGSIEINLETGEMKSPQGIATLAKYIEIGAANGSKPIPNIVQFAGASTNITLLFLKDYNKILLVDDNTLNSTFIKMFFFEEFDSNLFDLRIRNNFAKVYRIK